MNAKITAHARLKAARRALVLDHPFFGHLALGMGLQKETRGRTRTIATDGRGIYYDEAFVHGCSDVDLVSLFAHEVMHPALLHHTRRGQRDAKLWNDAGDYAINLLLQDAGFPIPEGWLLDKQYRGMTAEQIYDALKRESQDDGEEPPEAGTGASAGDDPSGDDAQASQTAAGEGDPRDDADGLAETPAAVWDAPEPAQQEAEWQVMLKQATQLASMMGRMPGGIACAVDQATQPRLDWRSLLRRFVQQFAASDYSWRRPNRRYTASGLYLPELRAEAMACIVVVADTSASTLRVLPVFMAELQSIVDECQPEETILIMADAAVQRVDRFTRGEPIEITVVGLGGTDFRPAFDHVEAEQLTPACLIYLTDGEGVFPDEPSDYPTLWAITSPGITAPWGETVTIHETAD
jgi:predicted metal-dependent peptidase